MKGLIAGVLAVLAAISSLAWCIRPEPEPLRLAIDPWPSNGLLWLAVERGKVGQLVTTPAELARMVKDSQARGLLALDWSARADVVLARSGVTAVTDLQGRAVAYEPGGLARHPLQSTLASAGLVRSDITARPMAVPSMNRAGEADAVVSYPPWSVECIRETAVQVVFDSKRIQADICDLLVVRPLVLQLHLDLPTRLAWIWGRIRNMDEADHSALAAIAKRDDMSPQDADPGRFLLPPGNRL